MKKVLILAYDFPPYVSVGGLRPYNWYKYLALYDVIPIVVTRQWSNELGGYLDYIADSASKQTIIESETRGTIIRTPYVSNLANRIMLKYGEHKFVIVRRVISAFYEFAQWIWAIGPKSNLYFEAKNYLKEHKVDVIIATGDPFILFKYASDLSREFNIPWIADYRDAWSQKKIYQNNFFLQNWTNYLEKQSLENVLKIVTVSEFVSRQISTKISDKQILVLPNGYDPEVINESQVYNQSADVLMIAYAGTIYDWHPFYSFLRTMNQFMLLHPTAKLAINFYGINRTKELRGLLTKEFNELQSITFFYERISNEQLMFELSKNNLLLLFNDYSVMGTKIYDYLAAKRAILFCYSEDVEALQLKEINFTYDGFKNLNQHLQEDLMKETKSGYIAKDAAHLSLLVEQLYEEFEKAGNISCKTENVEKYSRREQTKSLAEYIKEL